MSDAGEINSLGADGILLRNHLLDHVYRGFRRSVGIGAVG